VNSSTSSLAHPSIAVRVRRLPHAEGIELPAYMTAGAAAADIRAAVEAPVTIAPGSIVTIPTGLVFEIPEGWEIQIRPRSGLAVRHGITVVNSPATIDADYRGEVLVALVHLGAAPFTIERGMRIAQILLGRVTRIEWHEAAELTETGRGAGGFGHSGAR
jgi:dUTP pyrophosphatase